MGDFSRTTGERNLDEDLYRLRQELDALKNMVARLSAGTVSAPTVQTVQQTLFVGTDASGAYAVNALIFDASDGFGVSESNGGAAVTLTLILPQLTADPSSPQTGEAWYRTDLKQLSVKTAGAVERSSVFT